MKGSIEKLRPLKERSQQNYLQRIGCASGKYPIVLLPSLLYLERVRPLDFRVFELVDNSIAVRADWPEVVPVINEAMKFIVNRGGFRDRMRRIISKDLAELMDY